MRSDKKSMALHHQLRREKRFAAPVNSVDPEHVSQRLEDGFDLLDDSDPSGPGYWPGLNVSSDLEDYRA
jgi:hypothetical protein